LLNEKILKKKPDIIQKLKNLNFTPVKFELKNVNDDEY